MRKVNALVILLAVLTICVPSAGATGVQVTVDNGSTVNMFPWWPLAFPNGCRIQMLFDQSAIKYGGTVNEFELQKSSAGTGTFAGVKFYLCHTGLSALTTNFKNNYGGNTPVLVASFANYVLPARSGFYPVPMSATFTYNNTDNLILEITYESSLGSGGGLYCGSMATFHRCFGRGSSAETGTADKWGYNGRISFSYYAGAAPASLGRVKALFR
ncbi:MAG: hypothetical protein GTN49_00810 [candidate division Zixibacteria bacterium]|nr:hypothetical protein [candidate division Zixibacteria bacterium]